MSIYLIAPAAAVLTATALLASATLRLQGAAYLLGAYVLAWVEIVLLAEAASPAHAIGRVSYGLGEAVLLLVAASAWLARGRPRPSLPHLSRSAVAGHPVIAFLSLVVLAAFAYQAFIALAVPPNNVDALTYHLPRAAAWLQRGTLGYFPANTARDNAFPIVAEVGVLYTFVFSGRDTFAALPQLIAEAAVLVAIYGSALRLRFSGPAALFAALLTATLSEIALESTTAQNDLVVASFVAIAVFFILSGERRDLFVAACAVALGVGAKLTALFALPILAVLALAILPRHRLRELAAWSLAAFALVGAWTYADNLKNTGHALGVVPEDARFVPAITPASTLSTVTHIYYRFVDFSGVPVAADASQAVAKGGEWLFARARIEPPPHRASFSFLPNDQSNEDTSYFGALGVLIVIPLSLGFIVAGVLSRSWRSPRFVLACALPAFVIALSFANAYNPWLGRFMVIPVALTMPLAAWIYDTRLDIVKPALAIVGTITLVYTLANNFYDPTGVGSASPPIWSMNRVAAETIATPGLGAAIQTIDRLVPTNAAVGTDLTSGDQAYPLYGPRLSRTLTSLPRRDPIAAAAARGIACVVAARGRPLAAHPGWIVMRLENGWRLALMRETADEPRPPDSVGDRRRRRCRGLRFPFPQPVEEPSVEDEHEECVDRMEPSDPTADRREDDLEEGEDRHDDRDDARRLVGQPRDQRNDQEQDREEDENRAESAVRVECVRVPDTVGRGDVDALLAAVVGVDDVLQPEDAFAGQEDRHDDRHHVKGREPLQDRPCTTPQTAHYQASLKGNRATLLRFVGRDNRAVGAWGSRSVGSSDDERPRNRGHRAPEAVRRRGRARRHRPARRTRDRLRAARPQRCRQDDRSPHSDHAPAPRRGKRAWSTVSTS